METGIIQVYYGDGQGKSSAALGNAIRSASMGKSAYVIQFMKGQIESDYIARLEPEVKVFRFERSLLAFDTMSEEEKQEERINIQNGLNFAKKVLVTGECDVLVLDEILGLVEENMATVEDIMNVLQAKSLFTQVILTGRNLPEEIRAMADEVLNIHCES